MASKDLYSSVSVANALTSIVVNNDTEGKGATVDTAGAESCLLIVNCGISGDTLASDLDHNFLVQHSDTTTDGDFAAVTDSEYIVGATPDSSTGVFRTIDDATEDPAVFAVSYVGPKRYVRIVNDTAGTHTNGTPIGAVAVLGHLRVAP